MVDPVKAAVAELVEAVEKVSNLTTGLGQMLEGEADQATPDSFDLVEAIFGGGGEEAWAALCHSIWKVHGGFEFAHYGSVGNVHVVTIRTQDGFEGKGSNPDRFLALLQAVRVCAERGRGFAGAQELPEGTYTLHGEHINSRNK